MKNIIYLCNTEKGASGGAKIIYHHSEIINKLKNYSSQILHIKKKRSSKWKESLQKKLKINLNKNSGWQLSHIKACNNFKYKWFKNDVLIKNNLNFNKNKDFVILPEIFAHLADDLLIKNNIKYSIFVQNGYSIFFTDNEKKLNSAYNNAEFILSYSEDITKCIKLSFPKLKTRIIKIKYSIESKKFNLKQKKINLITYMSRKLPQHSYQVTNFLNKSLPRNWKIKDLKNMSEKQVYKHLSKSKIFLAFSNLEGLPLPPVEAAIAGNFVIGYTGEGGKEYWKKPIFTEIYSGDINNFVKKILKIVSEKNINSNKRTKQHKNIIKNFSKQNEIKHILKFLKLIN